MQAASGGGGGAEEAWLGFAEPVKFSRGSPAMKLSADGCEATGSGDGWCAVVSDVVMRSGKHMVRFTWTRLGTRHGPHFGLIRPSCKVEAGERPEKDDVCFYGTWGGWGYGTASSSWTGMQEAGEGDRIGMLLDLDMGTMTIFKNEECLGLMATGLSGEYCWAVEIPQNGPDSVRIENAPPEALAAAHFEAGQKHAEAEANLAAQRESGLFSRGGTNITLSADGSEATCNAPTSQFSSGYDGYRTAASEAVMRSGKHMAWFTGGGYFGLIRPEYDGDTPWAVAGHCFICSHTGERYTAADTAADTAALFKGIKWINPLMTPFQGIKGDLIGMLLDLDAGTMTIFKKNKLGISTKLGVMATGLSGEYCWAAGIDSHGSARIALERVGASASAQIVAEKAAAAAELQAAEQALEQARVALAIAQQTFDSSLARVTDLKAKMGAPVEEAEPPEKWRRVRLANSSSRYLTATSDRKGASIVMQEHEGVRHQQWRLTEHGHLQCRAGEFCIDIDGKNADEFAQVIMWDVKLPNPDFPKATNQMWVYSGDGYLVSKMHGMVLQVNTQGTLLQTAIKTGDPRQLWVFE